MADLAAANVTVTVVERRLEGGQGRKRRNLVKIVFGDGALTYPSGGVPMPGFASFGLVRNLDTVLLHDADDASGIVWKYDSENQKLRGFVQGVPHGTAGAATLDDYPVTAAVGTSAGASISRESGAGAATLMLGRLQELRAATDAPAAQTLYGEAIGW